MTLTKIGTDGVKDDAVTSDKVANSINSAIAANTAKTQTTINNNADNRVITGSGTANTLEGEANLTYNGTRLNVGTGDLAVTGAEGGDAQLRLTADEGDEGADYWRLESKASNNKFNLATYASGAWVDKVTVDTSGRVLIGTTTEGDGLADNLTIADSSNCGLTIRAGSSSLSSIFFADGTGAAGYVGQQVYNHSDNSLKWIVNGSEKARISNSGDLFVGVTSEPGQGSAGAQISSTSYSVVARQTSASAVFRAFGSDGEFRSLGNGNAQNTNNSYAGTSDRELKENEVDANSQWDDIKALQIKNYNFKTSPDVKHLGVIAQDLEASGMNGLVENNPDEVYTADDVLPEGKKIGDVKEKGYKSVKYSILYMKSVKALQEAIAKIETLETKVAALEAG